MALRHHALLALALAAGGCDEEAALDERAVAEPFGRVRDLTLLALPEGEMAIGWRDSVAPNDADAHAAFLRLGGRTLPVQRDENASTASTTLVATERTVLRVLAERGQDDPDDWGLVVVARDVESGELLPDVGYRTLPVFAGAELTDLHLVPTPQGALLAWIERAGRERPSDLVQLVALDDQGSPSGPPLLLSDLPTDVVKVDVASLSGGQEAVLVALARRDSSAQVWLFHFEIDEGVRLTEERQVDANVSEDDGVVDIANGGECLELLLTQRGNPVRGTVNVEALSSIDLQALHPEGETRGFAPRLVEAAGGSLLYLYDRADGSTRYRRIDHAAACEALVGAERRFPLPHHRCAELATEAASPLPYACATSCLTKNCGEQWIYFGRAKL